MTASTLTEDRPTAYRDMVRWLALVAASGLLASCTAGSGPGDAGGGMDSTTPADAGTDAGPTSCATNVDCDDGEECTIDTCVVGNVCEYSTLDERCPAGQRCAAGRGCISSCGSDADCDDGLYCNGVESCLVEREVCVPGMPRDCDDGNDCTLDACDDTLRSCDYVTAPGCDAGVPTGSDGGVTVPFDASMHYDGTFLFAPTQNNSCRDATYTVASLTFSVVGSELRVMADRFPLTQTPVPTGAAFDVSYMDPSCGTYRITGTFTDSDNFSGQWTASFTAGTCVGCGMQTATVIGARR